MKKSLVILILTALAATSFAAKVTNVQLAFENGETVAKIEVSGQIRFTHQTEIPKDGKPDRVIVDVLSATHELGAKVFENLPNCPITAIRTSQYSVKPEAVVRLVFDVRKTPVYQVESQGQYIIVHFVDKSATAFPSWSSTPKVSAPAKPAPAVVVAPKTETPKPTATVAQKNATAESDRQNSLATAPAKPATVAPVVAPVEKKPVTIASTPATPATTAHSPAAPASTATKSNPVTITSTPVTPAKTVPPAPATNGNPPTVAAVPKTEVKPVENKPVVTAPAAPTAAPAIKSEVKPIEPKPTPTVNPVVASTPAPANKPTVPVVTATPATTPVVKSDAKPVESKPSTPALANTKPTETKSAVPTAYAPVKPAESKPMTPSVAAPVTPSAKTDVKPVETKPTPVVASTSTPSTPKTEAKPAVPVSPTIEIAKPAPTVADSPSPMVSPNPVKPNPTPATSPMTSPSTPANKPSTPNVAAPTPAANQLPTATASKPAVSTPLAEVKSEATKPTPTSPVPSTASQATKPTAQTKQTYTTEDEDVPSPEDLEPAQENPYVDQDTPAGSRMSEDDAPVDSNSTARFRRRPLTAAQIKGTMIAQFPQRLVIKYESNGSRDPFATLIDDSRTFNTPTHQGVPNVDGLRLVGVIVARQGGNRALFIDKAGYSYMLKSGDKVRNGYVLRIESDRAFFQIFEYGWSRTVALKIDES